MMEENLRRAMLLSRGDPDHIFNRPFVVGAAHDGRRIARDRDAAANQEGS